MAQNNLDKLKENIQKNHRPFIVYDVETTGIMNGNDNRITQIALAAYDYNADKKQYELCDHLFMLARPDENVIKNIQKTEKQQKEDPEGTVIEKLKEDYIYSLIKKEPDATKRELIKDSRKDIQPCFISNNGYYSLKSSTPPDEMNAVTRDFLKYCEGYNRLNNKIHDVEHALSVEQILAKQGIDLHSYIHDGKGLTDAQMQAGITEFLKTFQKDNTIFVNNGSHFTRHYMEKAGLTFGNDADHTIDLMQAERSIHGDKKSSVGNDNGWTANFDVFADNYKKDTGKEIKIFDALTKALCIGEMTTSAAGIPLELNSKKYLENAVKTAAFEKDSDYVMSMNRLSEMRWSIADDLTVGDYHFSSLEYVDFGNDRRYVDLDKMFEMNDNFEITLEGEKTPIKTWEELKVKIKALNAEISEELLENIHEKYTQLYEDAMQKKAEQSKKYQIPESCYEQAHNAPSYDGEYETDDYEEDDYEEDASTPLDEEFWDFEEETEVKDEEVKDEEVKDEESQKGTHRDPVAEFIEKKIAEADALLKKQEQLKEQKESNKVRMEAKFNHYRDYIQQKVSDLCKITEICRKDITMYVNLDDVRKFYIKADKDSGKVDLFTDSQKRLININDFGLKYVDTDFLNSMLKLIKNWDRCVVVPAYERVVSDIENDLKEYAENDKVQNDLDQLDQEEMEIDLY